jgi:hypothetical protein
MREIIEGESLRLLGEFIRLDSRGAVITYTLLAQRMGFDHVGQVSRHLGPLLRAGLVVRSPKNKWTLMLASSAPKPDFSKVPKIEAGPVLL